MYEFHSRSFIIVGLTRDGKRFRPSDWAERLAGVLSAFGADRQMKYSPYVRPGVHDGQKAVFVEASLYDIEPLAYRFLVHFARDNELRVAHPDEAPEAPSSPGT